MGMPIYVVNCIFNMHFLLLSVLFITHDTWTNRQVTLKKNYTISIHFFIPCVEFYVVGIFLKLST